MIFQKGLDETTRFFCESNTVTSRRYFIKLMREEVDRELNEFKESCVESFSRDMLILFEEVYKESHFHLDVMEDFFIKSGKANFCESIYLNVEERQLFRVEDIVG